MAEPAVPAGKLTISDFTRAVESKVDEKIQGRVPLDNAPLGSQDVDVVWKKIFDVAEKYDNGMCQSFNAHIDTVLVFGGLFSAVVTAFTVESYKWLHDDSGDATVKLLAQIAGTSIPSTSALPDSQAIRINAYWFLALLLSLSSAFVAILARQWVLEFERRYRQSHRDGLAVRQAKLVGLEKWHLEHFASTYPLIFLQISLVLFVAGILELLWTLNKRVAVPAIVVSAGLAAVYVVTTFFSCIQLAYVSWTGIPSRRLSPYQSPQAWFFLRLLSHFAAFTKLCAQLVRSLVQSRSFPALLGHFHSWRTQRGPFMPGDLRLLWDTKSWIDYDFQWTVLGESDLVTPETRPMSRVDYAFDAIAWLLDRLPGSELAEPVWHCIWTFAAAVDDRRSSIVEKHRIALRLGYLTLSSDVYDGYDSALHPWILLLDLSSTNGAQSALIFELLHLAQRASLRVLKLPEPAEGESPGRRCLQPEWMLRLIRACDERITSKTVDEETCRHLLATLSNHSVWGEDLEFIEATGIALRIINLTESIPSASRRGLVEDMCGRLRQWLLWRRAHSPEDPRDMLDSATLVLLRAVRLLGINILGRLDPGSEKIRAVAGLASAAAAFSPDLFMLLAYLRSENDIRPGLRRLIEIGATVNPVPGPAAAPEQPVPRASQVPANAADVANSGVAPDMAAARPDGFHAWGSELVLTGQQGEASLGDTGGPRARNFSAAEHGDGAAPPGEERPVSESDTLETTSGSDSQPPSLPSSSALAVSTDVEKAQVDGSRPRATHRSLLGNVPERDIERGEDTS